MEDKSGYIKKLEDAESKARSQFLKDWSESYLSNRSSRKVRKKTSGEDEGRLMRLGNGKPELKLISNESKPDPRRQESWSIEGILFLFTIVGFTLLGWFGIGYAIWRLTR